MIERRSILCFVVTVCSTRGVEAQVKKERSATGTSTGAAFSIKRSVEEGDIEALTKYYRNHPADDRFRTVEADVAAAPLIEMDMMGMKSYSRLKDPTVATRVERDTGKVLITVLLASGELGQTLDVRHAVRWGLVAAKDLGTNEITESTSGVIGGGTKKRTAHMLEVKAVATKFSGKVVLFSSRPEDGVDVKDRIIEVTASPKP